MYRNKYFRFVLFIFATIIVLIYWINEYRNNYIMLLAVIIMYFLFIYLSTKCYESIAKIKYIIENKQYILLVFAKKLKIVNDIVPLITLLLYAFSSIFLYFSNIQFSLYLIILDMYILFISYEGIKQIILFRESKLYTIHEEEIDISKMTVKRFIPIGFTEEIVEFRNGKVKYI